MHELPRGGRPGAARDIEATARLFGTPLVLAYQNETPGLLPSEAERLGKITIGTELGWGAAVQASGVRWGKIGVWNAAIRHGQLAGAVEVIDHLADGTQKKAAMIDRECFTIAPFAVHYEPLMECGAEVHEGDVVGLLHDFDRLDLEPWPACAGVDGIVVAQAWLAPVRQGQHVVITGRPLPWLGPTPT